MVPFTSNALKTLIVGAKVATDGELLSAHVPGDTDEEGLGLTMLKAFGAAAGHTQHVAMLFSCSLGFQEKRFGFGNVGWLSGKQFDRGNALRFGLMGPL